MNVINQQQLVEEIANAIITANTELSGDIITALDDLKSKETNLRALSIFSQIDTNIQLAKQTKLPLCQDTGICVLDVTIGNRVQIDFDLEAALNQGIRLGYQQGNLRKSVVSDPLRRVNSGDNTPGIIHYHFQVGEQLIIKVAPKGAGSENMSQLKMFNPQTEIAEITEYIIDCVVGAGGKPCPPVVVGVGIGGTFEKAALNSKLAAIGNINQPNSDPLYANLEQEIKQRLNNSNVGAQGLGGNSTCLDVNIIAEACHIASLPVAVNLQCHVARHQEVIL